MIWRYGITTHASRVNDLLPRTISSLRATGFTQPVIFLDGICDWYTSLETVAHTRLGHLRNYLTSLAYLYLTEPTADRYAIFEDDLLACSNLRAYLEASPLPEKSYWNLFTHDQNLVRCGPTSGWHKSNQMGRGAVGLVFDNPTVEALLKDDNFIKAHTMKHGKYGADGTIITALKPLGYTEYVHNPSLLQHIGLQSVMGHKYKEISSFVGEDYNPLLLLETSCT